MKLLLLSLFISSLFASDTDKLYQNGKDIKVEIFKNKSFKVTREDGTILRLPTTYEQFYSDKSNNKLEIDYKIIEKIGGVDIEYSIKNPTSNPQNIRKHLTDARLLSCVIVCSKIWIKPAH